jgi:hypothetical protein
MEQSMVSDPSADKKTNETWSEARAVELWKYFGSVGGGDKNTMVQVCNLLRGFSLAIVAFAFGSELKNNLLTPR